MMKIDKRFLVTFGIVFTEDLFALYIGENYGITIMSIVLVTITSYIIWNYLKR